MTQGYWLNEYQVGRLVSHLPKDTRCVPRFDDRRVISGIIHVLQSGCRRKDAPKIYGPHKTLYNRFVRWAEKGVWERLFHYPADAGGPPATLMIDATHIKAHRSAARGKGGLKRRPLGVRVAAERPNSTPQSMNKADPGN